MRSPSEPRKVVIVTGASQGIGAGIARGFRDLDYLVVATSLSMPPWDAADVHTVQGDISQAETARRIVEETLDRFGRIDTLINNAGSSSANRVGAGNSVAPRMGVVVSRFAFDR
jgi:NAD(P)-dependent dehydrogenase (short-subunit alcohol dehydrogenase family)